MGKVIVKEGSSGIINVRGLGKGETFIPDCDLDQALELLFRIYDLRAQNGRKLKENYHYAGHNWFSGQVSYVFWRCCYRFVQYKDLLQKFLGESINPVFVNKVNLARLWEIMHPGSRGLFGNRFSYRFTLPRHNRKVAASSPGSLFFYRYGPGDFRSSEMLRHFENKNIDFSFVYSPSKKIIKRRSKQDHPVYFLYRKLATERIFQNQYDLSGFSNLERLFLQGVVNKIETSMSHMYQEYRHHLENLSVARPRLFFGLDDCNEVYPILFACRELGIPSVGYQLGMYSRLQASYALERWEPGEYEWYDKVICWGKYWEDVIRRYNRTYPDDFFILGANKHNYGYARLDSPRFDWKNVLIPYEFFANTYKIGQYIQKLMDLGYRVYFKFKPDERPERQIASYCLPDKYAGALIPVFDINDELMAEINIVAGAMTTLLYDLLPYGKETWVLDTEFGLLDDMVKDKLARRVGLKDLDDMTPPTKADHRMDYTYIFNNRPLGEVLDEHVLSRL